MDDSCGSGKAKDINGPQPFGAHAKAAHMKIMISGPSVPTKVSIVIMKVGKNEAVKVREVVVDPHCFRAWTSAVKPRGSRCSA
eukprot:scaffold1598_cov121-Isochrysis_galbana.AAC.1